ncbi:TetR/AcrR family transcriptional regulator [Nocardioides ultimimeridianus]
MRSLEPTEDFAIVLVRRFLRLCEHPRTRARMLRMIRNATKHGDDSPRLYRWINRVVLHPAAPARMRSMSAMKAELVASQLVGLAMVRYVLEVEPLASASVDEVVRLAAPSIAAALQGEDSLSGLVVPELLPVVVDGDE